MYFDSFLDQEPTIGWTVREVYTRAGIAKSFLSVLGHSCQSSCHTQEEI